MKFILVLSFLFLASCAHKGVSTYKNCEWSGVYGEDELYDCEKVEIQSK